MLHVLDGDATRADFERAGIAGEVVVWRPALCEAAPPTRPYGPDITSVLAAVDDALKRGDEVVTWFDEDLFCRVNAAFLAAQFPGARITNATGSHARRAPADMRAQLDARRPLAPTLAHAWRAYAAPDPRALLPLRASEPWIELHLRRFPDRRTGLDAIERALLDALATDDAPAFPDLYARVARSIDNARWGLGDLQIGRSLEALAQGPRPLVALEGAPLQGGRARITVDGRAVLSGRADRLALQRYDRWLGGVHLTGAHDAWRWDPSADNLIYPM